MLPPDEDLLNAFVKSHDEQAFRGLAERYSGLIFHTALRTLGDRTLAEDVAQRVLGVLAKKASHVARGNSPLPAWLHRTTILEAKSARRMESRYHRKKEAIMRAPADSPASDDPAWKDALPHLDAAIDTLPESDRQVLLLHFVNELTFPEIAARLGKSAAAVQKQSRRALEKLQAILGRRGVALSLAILTAGLTTEMAKAGPVLLIPALSTLGKTTTSVLVVKKTTVAALGTTLLLCGIPLARQQASISKLESRLRMATAAPLESRTPSAARGTKSPSLLERLARDLNSKGFDMPRYLSAVDHIAGLSDQEVVAFVKETISSSMSKTEREAIFAQLFQVLFERDVESCLSTLLDVVPADYIGGSQSAGDLLENGVRTLSEHDGVKALAWFREHLETIRSIRKSRSFPAEYWENKMRVALAYGLVFSDPSAAVEVLRPLPIQELTSELSQLVRSREPTLRKDATGFIQVARQLFPEKESHETVAELVGVNLAANDKFQSVDVLLEKYEFTPAEIDAILEKTGKWHLEPASREADGMEKAISEFRAWLESRKTDDIDRLVGETLGETVLSWSRTGEPVYQAMLRCRELGLGDDAILGLLETAGFSLGKEKSGPLAAMLSNPEAAREVLLKIQHGNAR